MPGEDKMTGVPMDPATVEEFGKSLRGQLIRPGDERYEEARHVWNGMIDKRPAIIVQCSGVADVIGAVNFARDHGLLVAIRGGAHNVAGNATCDGGMVIDLSKMKSVRVDPEAHTARAEPGLTWAEFDRETQAFGLATNGGLVSTTGIAGFTLGGGIGWLSRAYGLTCDNLLSVDVVTADGRLVKASAHDNPDLFWGVRGGGGNFGVVTSFEYKLYPVGPMVLGGLILHPAAKAREFVRFYRDFSTSAPDDLTTMVAFVTAPPAPFVPESLHGKPVVGVAMCWAGEPQRGMEVVRPLKEFGPPVVDLVGPMPYLALQAMFDPTVPPGLLNYWKSEYLSSIPDDAISVLTDFAGQVSSPLTQVHVHQLGGAVRKTSENETAFSHRGAPFLLNILSIWTDPTHSQDQVRWARDFHQTMQRFSEGGAYVNFMGEEGEDRIRGAYGDEKYRRLVALKDKYDPTNFFRLNQNIRPSGEASRREKAA